MKTNERKLATSACAGAVSMIGACALATPTAASAADLILKGGEIYTPTGWVEAAAISDGVVVAVGTASAIAPQETSGTRVVDLHGAAVLPGLHDMHVHPLGAGLAQLQCGFPQGSDELQIVAALEAFAAKRASCEWIVGGQWDAASFGPRPMHRSILDRAAPNSPVALVDISGHSLWVSTRALEAAGITASTPDPADGIIERNAAGELTGVLRESAGGLVRRVIPPNTADQLVAALRWSLDTMLSFGITPFTDAGVDDATLTAYAALADQGVLHQRVKPCMM